MSIEVKPLPDGKLDISCAGQHVTYDPQAGQAGGGGGKSPIFDFTRGGGGASVSCGLKFGRSSFIAKSNQIVKDIGEFEVILEGFNNNQPQLKRPLRIMWNGPFEIGEIARVIERKPDLPFNIQISPISIPQE